MRKLFLVAFVLVLTTALAPTAWAADDGNTQPKFSSGYLNSPYGYYEVIGTTSGTGNVKGIRCSTNDTVYVNIYVNGGSAQQLIFVQGAVANYDTEWVPMNVRFTSSIRVRIERPNSTYTVDQCYVSWALD
jgi:hypothetical protein